MIEKIDLHCHTNASDGAFSPKDIALRAIARGLRYLAITDHDCVNGIKEAQESAKDSNLTIIPGIEISTTWRGAQIHIVGLCIDYTSKALLDLIARQRVKREQRAQAIGLKLEKLGFKDALAKTKEQASDGAVITRGNYARFLVSTGLFSSTDEAFNKYLKKGGRAYVNTEWIDVKEACEIILLSGGIPVLAHPKRYTLTNTKLRALIEYFKEAGGIAIEVSSSQQSPDDRRYLADLCTRYDMLASCGSDFHTENRWRDLGLNLAMPDSVKPVWTHKKAQEYFKD